MKFYLFDAWFLIIHKIVECISLTPYNQIVSALINAVEQFKVVHGSDTAGSCMESSQKVVKSMSNFNTRTV